MGIETKAPQSQFAYVVVASRRARQLMAGAPPMIENPHTQKPTRIAAEELDMGLLEYETPDTGSEEDKEAKRRK